MTAYLNIFEWKSFTLIALLAVIFLASFVNKASFAAKSVLISSTMWLAPLFYLAYILFQSTVNFSVYVALITETSILVLWLSVLGSLFKCLSCAGKEDLQLLSNWMNVSILIQLASIIYFISQPNFGLFSDGSRIDYLDGSRLNIYLTYASALSASVAAPIAAAIININEKWDKRAIVYIIVVMLVSILSGSKGVGVLLLISVICYIRIANKRIYTRIVLTPVIFAGLFLVATVFFVGTYLHLDPQEMSELMLNRIFLANDGRALAIDFSSQINEPNISLFRESYRSAASTLGAPPLNAPLGHLLYQQAFSIEALTGANTSATSLLIAYGSDIEKIIFAISIIGFAVLIYLFSRMKGRSRIIRLSLAVFLLFLLSQDFLAFQVSLNLILAFALVFFSWKFLMRQRLIGLVQLTEH